MKYLAIAAGLIVLMLAGLTACNAAKNADSTVSAPVKVAEYTKDHAEAAFKRFADLPPALCEDGHIRAAYDAAAESDRVGDYAAAVRGYNFVVAEVLARCKIQGETGK